MGTFRRIWKNRRLLLPILELIEKAVRSATTLAQIKEAIKEGIDKGDLDAPLKRFQDANKRAKDYIKTGK